MNSMIYEQPPALTGDERAQLQQLYRYLFKLSEQLNTSLEATDRQYRMAIKTRSGSENSDDVFTPELDAKYRELRSLIIKTADIVNQKMDRVVTQLNSEFQAISNEWGTFEQNIERTIIDTAENTIEQFDYSEHIYGIDKTVMDGVTYYGITSLGYIKRGIIGFDDQNFPIYGIAVGTELKEKTVIKDGKEYQQIDTSQRIATYTSDRITFWANGVELAYFSGDKLFVTRVEVTDGITIGDMHIDVNDKDGLSVGKQIGNFIDISENETMVKANRRIALMVDGTSTDTKLVLTDQMLEAIASNINLSANESISLIVGDAVGDVDAKISLIVDDSSTASSLVLTQTALTAIADQIDLSANKTVTITAAQINEVADQIDISGNKYLKLAVDGVKVGGTNLIRESGEFQTLTRWKLNGTNSSLCEAAEKDGYKCLHAIGSIGQILSIYRLEWSAEYTLHCTAKFTTGGTTMTRSTPMHFWMYKSNDPNVINATNADYKVISCAIDGTIVGDGTTEITANVWHHLEFKFKTPAKPADAEYLLFRPYFYGGAAANGCEYWIRWIKLEKGNRATDWSPAPEDVEGEIDGLKERMSSAELKITDSAIVSTVTSSESYKTLSGTANTNASNISALTTRMSTAEQKITADAIVSTVTSSTSYKALSSTAETAQSTANTAKSTADTAKTKADGNATDITGLKTRMTTAESKIDQKADSITLSVLETKVDGISVGGTNLLPNTGNIRYEMTSSSSNPINYNSVAIKCSSVRTSLVGQQITLSFTVNTPGDGQYVGDVSSFLGRFGAHLVATWSDSTGTNTENVTKYPCASALDNHNVTSKRVSATSTLTPPTGYDTLAELRFAVQIYWKPAADNPSTWFFEKPKLEVGNKATDWSPAPEDPAGSLSVSSDYSKVDINTERVRIVSKRMEVAVPSDDGEDDVLRVDADGVHAEEVDADRIVSESVVHTQGTASYTPADAGELAVILDELSGKHLTARVNIDCKNVTSGNYEVANLSGEGAFILRNGKINRIKITNCGSVPVYFYNTEFSNSETALLIDNSLNAYFSACVINAAVGLEVGIDWPAKAILSNCHGDCTVLAKLLWGTELRIYGASKPYGSLSLGGGCEVYNATPDPTFAAKASPSIPTTQTVTASLSPTSTSTSGYGSKLYQGRYSSSQSLRKGVMLFSLPSDLTSADKIDSATLTIKRIGGVGQGGGVSVHVRCYDVPGTLYASKTAYNGQTVSIDVTSAVKAMKTNGYGGLMLYNPNTTTVGSKSYTASYSRFAGKGESGAPVLKVSYRK